MSELKHSKNEATELSPKCEHEDHEYYKRKLVPVGDANNTVVSIYEIRIKNFEKADIPNVIEFEKSLRMEEPDTYFWEPNDEYALQLEKSFEDPRYTCSISCLAYKDDKVIGRIDASLIASRSDAVCYSAYLDWISVLKSERHNKVGQALLKELRRILKEKGVGILIALMANNEEAQRFYGKVENASIHDTGIWIKI